MTVAEGHDTPEVSTDADFLQRTRTAYDTVAADYTELLKSDLASNVWDRTILGAFAEIVLSSGLGPVADLGCGNGRIAAHLDSLGVPVFGVDLSPNMVTIASQSYPHLKFDVGSITALKLDSASVGAVMSWYSIIHLPPTDLPSVIAEFWRVLVPGGQLLLAFQVGDECVHLEQAYGHQVSYDAYRLAPERILNLLQEKGFVCTSQLLRAPVSPERTPQAYLMVTKPKSVIERSPAGSR